MAVDFYQIINSGIDQGSDIKYDVTNSILTVDGTDKTEQRIMRRLMTNPGDYFWHPKFGVGLPARVGTNLTSPIISAMRADCISQIAQTDGVAAFPAPTVAIQQTGINEITVTIGYTDSTTNESRVISFTIKKP